MVPETPITNPVRSGVTPWKIGFILETPALASALYDVLEEINTTCVFHLTANTAKFEIAGAVERDRPDVLFVELARIEGAGPEWIEAIRVGRELPLMVAVNPELDPQSMIDALRAGASEYLSLPLRPAVFEAMERIGTLLEAQQTQLQERGRMTGILSAKGGCGATTIACYLGVAMQAAMGQGKVLIADFDTQSPSAHRILRVTPQSHLGKVFESVRRLHSGIWPEFVSSIAPGVDLLAGQERKSSATAVLSAPEPWRIDNLFRFLSRNYSYVLVDLGRHLNPTNWSFLQNLDDLIVVTAPDVLALYQTRSILQTLTGRGFEKTRLRLILNRNLSGPRDFWVESIEQMFEMSITSVVPDDHATFAGSPGKHFEFPANSQFGRALTKTAARILKPVSEPGGKGTARKAA